MAANKGHLSVLKTLLDHRAEMEAADLVCKARALHAAARQGHTECVSLLVQRGADTTAKDGAGNTPRDVADNKEVEAVFDRFQQGSKGGGIDWCQRFLFCCSG